MRPPNTNTARATRRVVFVFVFRFLSTFLPTDCHNLEGIVTVGREVERKRKTNTKATRRVAREHSTGHRATGHLSLMTAFWVNLSRLTPFWVNLSRLTPLLVVKDINGQEKWKRSMFLVSIFVIESSLFRKTRGEV